MTTRQNTGPVSVIIDDRDFVLRLARYKPRIAKLGRPIMTDMLREIETPVIRGMRPYADYKNPPNKPIQVRTGALRSSVNVHIKGVTIKGVQGRITAGNREAKYARAQEFGGIIRPRRARYLRVPLPDTLLPSGEIRPGDQIVRANRFGKTSRRGRSWSTADGDPTFIRDGVIYARRPGGDVDPIYKLRRSVRLTARRYVFNPFDKFRKGPRPRIIILRHLSSALGKVEPSGGS